MRKLLLAGLGAAALSSPATAQAADRALATATIGDFVLWFNASTWRVERDGDTYAIHSVEASPRDLPISVEISNGKTPCSPEAVGEIARLFHPDAWEYQTKAISRPGFDLHLATLDMGCRNWTGSPVFACTAYLGNDYYFTANPGGCRETPPMYDEPVVELLMGLAVR